MLKECQSFVSSQVNFCKLLLSFVGYFDSFPKLFFECMQKVTKPFASGGIGLLYFIKREGLLTNCVTDPLTGFCDIL